LKVENYAVFQQTLLFPSSGHFWQPCVGGDLDLMMLIGGVEEQVAIK
jgi:hypothetical protein